MLKISTRLFFPLILFYTTSTLKQSTAEQVENGNGNGNLVEIILCNNGQTKTDTNVNTSPENGNGKETQVTIPSRLIHAGNENPVNFKYVSN